MSAIDTTAAAAAGILEDIAAEVQAETPAVEETAPDAGTEVPTLEPELPADVLELLDEEPEDEPPDDDDDTVAEYEEPLDTWQDDDTKLRREYEKLKKKAGFLEKQNLKVARREWESELAQYFPLSDAKGIAAEATSRRDALRQAQAQHMTAKKGAETVSQYYEQNIEKIVAERIDAEREKLHAQWGRPIGGPGQAAITVGDQADARAAIANARSLHERILLKMKSGQLAPELTVTESPMEMEE